MPANRIGFSSDFVLVNQQVGIGTTLPAAKLQVKGTLKGDFNVSGVSTLTVYGGFVGQKQNVSLASTIGFSTSGVGTFVQVTESETGYTSLVGEYNTVSEDIIVDEGRIFEVSVGSTVSPGTLESVSIQSHFSVPNGGSSNRPNQPTEGMVRFNDDLNTLEFYNGIEWRQFTVSGASGRGVFGGGNYPNTIGEIEFITLSSGGTSTNFGNLSFGRNYNLGTAASSTRGLFAGGYTNTPATNTRSNVIDYITISSEGNSIDFGDRTVTTTEMCGCSSSTRGLFAGGFPVSNTIDYVQIATIGNALDFGDLSQARNQGGALASPTRGVFAGGRNPFTNIIDFVTIASVGNAVDFGDLTITRAGTYGCCSNSTRGLISGGSVTGTAYNTIEYITIATTGNATVFGDLSLTSTFKATSSSTRGVFHQGATVDSVIISTTGNATRFATLSRTWTDDGALSDSHGGLGGF
jgi:hypothetical protein